MTEISPKEFPEVGMLVSQEASGSKVAAILACAAAPADLALSDSIFAQAQQAINSTVARAELAPALEWIASRGAISGVIAAESIAVGYAVSRSKRLQGAFGGFDEYMAERQEKMGGVRKAISVGANAPFAMLGKVGEAFENLGERFEKSDSPTVQSLGEWVVDAGKTNAIGTTGVILSETGQNDEPLPLGRIARLGGIITASWVGASEAVRYGYRGLGYKDNVPGHYIQNAIGFAGRFVDAATSVDYLHPTSTPVGAVVMTGAATLLGITGRNVVNYQEQNLSQ